jgi:hypothetical protein
LNQLPGFDCFEFESGSFNIPQADMGLAYIFKRPRKGMGAMFCYWKCKIYKKEMDMYSSGWRGGVADGSGAISGRSRGFYGP